MRYLLLSIFVLLTLPFTFSTTGIQIYPSSVTMSPGKTVRFTVIAYDSDGTMYTPNQVKWQTYPGNIYDGNYTAPDRSGNYTITATWNNYQAKASVNVKQSYANINRIVIKPYNPTVNVSGYLQFKAIAYNNYNQKVSFSGKWWTDNGGNITSSGYYTAGYRPGRYTVWVKDPHSGVQASTYVTITRQVDPHPNPNPNPGGGGVVKIVITPRNQRVSLNSSLQFQAYAYDRYDRQVNFNAKWWTDGGNINRSGYFTAGYRPGNYTIWVKDTHSGVQTSTVVEIVRDVVGNDPHYPPTSDAKIEVIRWHIDNNGFFHRPQAEIKVQVSGRTVQKASLFGIYRGDKVSEIETKSCSDGDEVYFKEKFSHDVYWLEVRLYDSYDNIIARYKASAK